MHDWSKEIEDAIAPLNLSAAREAGAVGELSQHLNNPYDELLVAGTREEEACRILMEDLTNGGLVAGLKGTTNVAHQPAPLGAGGATSSLRGIWNDLHYGARLLLRSPRFAAVAILSLALGIGADTTILQLLDGVRLRTLPVKKPERLATVAIVNPSHSLHGGFLLVQLRPDGRSVEGHG